MTNLTFELVPSSGYACASGTLTDLREYLTPSDPMRATPYSQRLLRMLLTDEEIDWDYCPILYVMDGENEVATLGLEHTFQFLGQLL